MGMEQGHGPAVLWPERQQLKNLSEEKEQMLNKKMLCDCFR